MDTSLYVGLSRQVALGREFDLVAHNIANANTTAFKGDRMLFDDAIRKAGAAEPVAFTIDKASFMDMSQGALVTTNNDLDVAVRGDGWLAVQTDNGIRFTRDGRMALATDGTLVTKAGGHPVLDVNFGPVTLDRDGGPLEIATDGTLTQRVGELDQQMGQLGLFQFAENQNLLREGDSLYNSGQPPAPAVESQLVQGSVEQSNIQPIMELTRLMELARSYEQASNFIKNGDDLKRDAITRLGRAR